jgi:hypothetical protein
VLLLVAAVLWTMAAIVFSQVQEFAGETGGGADVVEELRRSAGLLVSDAPFRRFVITRALLMCSALSAPFFVVLAQRGGSDVRLLGGFLFASSLASSVSALFWGRMADDSSQRVMVRAGAIAAAVCLSIASFGWLLPDSW